MYRYLKFLSIVLLLMSLNIYGMEKGRTKHKPTTQETHIGPFYVERNSNALSSGIPLWQCHTNPENAQQYVYKVFLSQEAATNKTFAQLQLTATRTVELLKTVIKEGCAYELPELADLGAKIYTIGTSGKALLDTFECDVKPEKQKKHSSFSSDYRTD